MGKADESANHFQMKVINSKSYNVYKKVLVGDVGIKLGDIYVYWWEDHWIGPCTMPASDVDIEAVSNIEARPVIMILKP